MARRVLLSVSDGVLIIREAINCQGQSRDNGCVDTWAFFSEKYLN